MYRERIVVSGFIALALLFACGVFYDQSGYPWVFAAATAYTALWFVFAPGMQWFNRFGDYSYGLYLYGYPSQQLVAHWFPQFGPWRMAALALPLALCCAIASWHCVEKPFLRLK
jgi:peptidoglycan/LPS O-acetylase OafA/YrhL